MKSGRRDRAGAIDWQGVRARLARALAATEEAARPSPGWAREVLEERARVLARVPPAPPWAGETIEVVTFALASEQYALPTRFVREVVRLADPTPLPGAPPFLAGVLNLRGDLLALVDLRPFLGTAAHEATGPARVLVLGDGRAEFGILADAAHEVRILRADEVLGPPPAAGSAGREWLRGVTREALVVLDGAALLQDGRLFIDEEGPP
jgi:purine-binding chemotaxis protein CheW